jgi:hypothetical protein
MRSKREHVIVAAMVATAMVSNQAVGAEPAPAEAAPATAEAAPAAATAQPAPKLAATPHRPAQATDWHEGFMLVPSAGIHSIQGDAGQSKGPGLRLGLMAGSRMGENWSLNVGFAFDKVNWDVPTASDYVFDLGFNPLFHFPNGKLEIVAGPVLGVFLDKGAVGTGTIASDIWTYGWTLGANAGLLFPVGSKVRLGGLLNFFLRNPIKACYTANGTDTCQSNGLNSAKVLALSVAAIL